MNKLCIISFFLIVRITAVAQTMGYDAIATNKDIKISLTDIIGNWYTTDSSASKISFINISNYFVDIEGFNHGVGGNYSFRVYGDSMSVNGTAPNWPPYNCSLRLLKNNHLEIEFYQFLSTVTTKIIYRRSNNE
jgi:hypothetical protein